jgi:hypothetical protein
MHARPTHPTGTPRQGRHGGSQWHIIQSVAIMAAFGLTLISSPPVEARTFHCRAGDVACLIAAINTANTQPGPQHEIRLEAGVYTLVDVYEKGTSAGWNGLPSITGNLTIQGAGADLTVIERNSPDSFRLIHMAATSTLTLEGLTLRGGEFITGGAILNAGGTLRITHSALTQNFDIGPGGGSVRAGAIYNSGTVTIIDTIFADNFSNGFSGAISNDGGTMTIADSLLADNGAFGNGGAIENRGVLAITNSTLARNVSVGDFRGFGGAIQNLGTLMIVNSTLIDNLADYGNGGAIGNFGTLTIVSGTLARNTAGPQLLGYGDGGAIANYDTGTLTILNSTLAGNTAATSGGGVAASGMVYLQNTILAQNTASTTSPDCANSLAFSSPGTIISQGNNLIGSLSGCTVPLRGTDRLGEPGLGPFSDDETPGNGHFPLLSTSQAINRGNPAVCPKTDQLGEKRVGICDIGAIEFQGTAVASQ